MHKKKNRDSQLRGDLVDSQSYVIVPDARGGVRLLALRQAQRGAVAEAELLLRYRGIFGIGGWSDRFWRERNRGCHEAVTHRDWDLGELSEWWRAPGDGTRRAAWDAGSSEGPSLTRVGGGLFRCLVAIARS